MPLEVLAILVVLGVGGVVLAIHLSGGTITAKLRSPDEAIGRFCEDFPDATINSVIISKNGQTAVLALPGGDCGIVHAVGDRFLTRYFTSDNRPAVQARSGAALSLRINDISWRGSHIVFSSDEERDRALAGLTKGESQDG